ncbi:IclR family transcriptional regulator [Phytohabitans kaempferiae]|uniref:IclR family transcriptional regulator n=1 Tax=Phytohabitans kaempferiae TaxID=1620943 RepID=A0ABV6M2X1_9ACTN
MHSADGEDHPSTLTGSGGADASSSVRSATRALHILEYVGAAGRGVRLAEIVNELDIPKTSAHSLIKSLVSINYLVPDQNRGYRLGLRVFELGTAVDITQALIEAGRPELLATSRATGCTCNLGILDGYHVFYVDKVQDSETRIQIVTRVGGRLPVHATAMGKVLLSGLTDHALDSWIGGMTFEPLALRTVTDPAILREQVIAARTNGFAVDDEESHPNVVCVAAPVVDAAGKVIAAVSVTGLRDSMVVDGDYPARRTVQEMGRRVSAALR